MRTKITVLLLALLLSAPALAQQPRIDSIAVDEDKGELVLHGAFQNSASAVVTVDSVSLPITMSSDTLLRAKIPVIGKGSAGIVKLIIGGLKSNSKLLTYYHFHIYYFATHRFSDGGDEERQNYDTIHIRTELTLQKNDIDFPVSKLSRCHDIAFGNDGIHGYKYTGPKYDTTGVPKISIYFNPANRTFYYSVDNLESEIGSQGRTAYIRMDQNDNIIPGTDDFYCEFANGGGGSCFHWSSVLPTDFPSSASIVRDKHTTPNFFNAYLTSNPISVNTNVIITLQNGISAKIEIMDILGLIITSEEKMLWAGINSLPINSSKFAAGIYIFRLQAGGEVVSLRFVKE